MELMQASRQWATRPDDQRFTSLTQMLTFAKASRQLSTESVVASREIRAVPVDDNKGLGFEVRGELRTPTNWSFGQIASRVSAPASYLRKLPSPIAADCLNYGLQLGEITDTGVLANSRDVRAFTGPNYGRIWNSDVIDALVNRFGDGVTGDFRVPGEFGKAVEVNKGNTTLYASDRDMFVFLADEKNRVEVPNRRNGEPGQMARGFFVWNSEVGSATFGIAAFLFDYVCMNRIVWGATEYKEIRIRHTASAPWRMLEEVYPAIEAYAQSSTGNLTETISNARKAKFDDADAVNDFLAQRFSVNQAKAINLVHLAEEGRPIENYWDAVTGITAYARAIPFQDSRIEFERQAGKVLDLVAA